jgi:hypothetical protein
LKLILSTTSIKSRITMPGELETVHARNVVEEAVRDTDVCCEKGSEYVFQIRKGQKRTSHAVAPR